MEVYGYDSIFLTPTDAREIVIRFLTILSRRWRRLRLDVDGMDEIEPGQVPTHFPKEVGHIFVTRNKKMISHLRSHGQVLMPFGEGPVSLHYVMQPDGTYEITIVTPEDPERDNFSKSVCDILREASPDLAPLRAGMKYTGSTN